MAEAPLFAVSGKAYATRRADGACSGFSPLLLDLSKYSMLIIKYYYRLSSIGRWLFVLCHAVESVGTCVSTFKNQ